MRRSRRAARAVAAASALALLAVSGTAVAPGAAAAAGLEIGMEDERLMLEDPARAPAAVAEWAALGVDVVRLHARWSHIAPGAAERRRPRGFRPADHRDPAYDWAAIDRAVELVRSAGMGVMLTVTGPGPLWSSRAPGRGDPAWRPDPREYARFAEAVARRYRGEITRYLLWNEPNIPGWLMPQATCRRSGCVPASPHVYRELVRAGLPALKAGDPGTPVLIGELAPVGGPLRSPGSIVTPLRFLREMACVDDRFRAIRGGRCRRFQPASGDGIGHHPHGQEQAPSRRSADRDWAKLADLPRLRRTLARLAATGRLRPLQDGRFDVWLTEFGYQTSPPDHFTGIPLSRHNAWLQEAAYLASEAPGVRGLTYYQWEDEPVRRRGVGSIAYAGWQSGLLYVTGEPKPAYRGFAAPLVVDRPRSGSAARLWAQIRPGSAHAVTVQRRSRSGWTAIARLRTDAGGVLRRRLAVRPGDRLRLAFAAGAGSRTWRSGTVRVPARGARVRAAAANARVPAPGAAAAAFAAR